MKNIIKPLPMLSLLLGTAALLAFSTPHAAAEGLSDEQKAEVQTLIGDYLKENPKIVSDALAAHQANEHKREQEAAAAKLKDYNDYFETADLPFAGNPDGDITVVEFFDYNCGFCKRALTDIEDLLKDDKDVKVVFQEMPILGPASRVMAEYSLAAHKQGKYFEYHQKIMMFSGPKEASQLEKLAKEVDLDVDQLKKDAKSEEIKTAIEKSIEIARAVGIRGTPGFIIGTDLHRGYLGPGGICLLYTSPSPRDQRGARMPSSA